MPSDSEPKPTPTHRLVMVGACYVDTILSVPHYPSEDEKLRASSLSRRRGGNCANSLEVLQQLASDSVDAHLVLISVLPEKASSASRFVASSFKDGVSQPEVGHAASTTVSDDPSSPPRYSSVDLTHSIYRPGHTDPAASYIVKSLATGSRTIVNTNPLPEMQLHEFRQAVRDFVKPSSSSSSTQAANAHATIIEEGPPQSSQVLLEPPAWFHFEGRNLPEITECAKWLRHLGEQPESANPIHGISVEVEKSGRAGLLDLAAQADIVFYSRSWAEHEGYKDAAECVSAQASVVAGARSKLLCCTWGADGAVARLPDDDLDGNDYGNREDRILRQPATRDAEGRPVVDTIGAGDTFIAGMLHKLVMRGAGGADAGAAARRSWTEASLVRDALEFATRLAGRKVMQEGFSGLA